MSRTPRPPAGLPRSLRDVTIAPPDLTRWGVATADQHTAAGDLLDTLADELKGGPETDHAGTFARLLFERGEAAGVAPAALVRRAVAEIAPDATADPARVQRNYADVLAAAAEVFGEPEAPDALKNYSHAGPVPAWVYDELPAPLARLARCYEPGPQRDTFLVSALVCCNAALPNLAFRYAKAWNRCNLFASIVAPSGAGKKPLVDAGRLLERIDEHLMEVSAGEIKRWEKAKQIESAGHTAGVMFADGEELSRECPPYRRVTFAGDISDADFFLGLHANGGHGVIVESEIATLVSVMGKEWGNFRPKLLNGWANERLGYNRKGQRPLFLTHPEISLVCSGTHKAFQAFIVDNEDGLFNRSGFYTFDAYDGWLSGWDEEGEDAEMDAAHDALAGVLFRAYGQLTTRRTDPEDDRMKRQVPLFARFAPDQKARLDAAFRAQKLSFPQLGLGAMATYTHRMAQVALRIAAGLSALRIACDGKDLSLTVRSYDVTEEDFRVGLQMGVLMMAHGVELARRHFRGVETAPQTGPAKEKKTPRARFLDEIGREFGSTTFMRADAVALIERVGRKRATGDNYLAELVAEGFLSREEGPQGLYCRTDRAPAVAARVAAPEAVAPDPIGYIPAALLWPPGQDGAPGAPPVVGPGAAPALAEPVAAAGLLRHPDHDEAIGLSQSPSGEPDAF